MGKAGENPPTVPVTPPLTPNARPKPRDSATWFVLGWCTEILVNARSIPLAIAALWISLKLTSFLTGCPLMRPNCCRNWATCESVKPWISMLSRIAPGNKTADGGGGGGGGGGGTGKRAFASRNSTKTCSVRAVLMEYLLVNADSSAV